LYMQLLCASSCFLTSVRALMSLTPYVECDGLLLLDDDKCDDCGS